ncbi:MAG: choice-of-anchor L domain-containing protein, partial [Desulfovibrionaceae bacterium]|nr:choice-of-anchor L domain-containing protein [Desulfovibrionaceae bacterium]
QGIRNANDAISMIQTADGALAVIDEKLIRMKELAEQAATGTYDSTQRLMIDSEFQAMAAEIDRIAHATDFNGIKLLDGSLNGEHDGSGLNAVGAMKIHFGTGNDSAEDYYYVDIPAADIMGLKLGGYLEVQEIEYGPSLYPDMTPPTPMSVFYADIMQATSTIMGEGITVIDASFTGHKDSLGVFENGAGAGLGTSMNNGLILSTGNVVEAQNPPRFLADSDMEQPGDSYINSPGITTMDASFLDIHFIPDSDMLYFNFVFATEEYPDYLNTGYNDVCGIKMWTNGALHDFTKLENIYSIDGKPVSAGLTGPISLNNIFNHPELFVDNQNGDESFTANGFSKTFRIGVPVTPGAVNHLHIGVGDVDDPWLDSWIMVSGFSTDVISPEIKNKKTVISVKPIDIKTQEKAQYALERIDKSIVIKDNIRAHLGALQNRFENTVTNLSIQAENLQASESRI